MESWIVVQISADEATHLNILLNQGLLDQVQYGNSQEVHDPEEHNRGEQMGACPNPAQHQIQSPPDELVEYDRSHNLGMHTPQHPVLPIRLVQQGIDQHQQVWNHLPQELVQKALNLRIACEHRLQKRAMQYPR